MADKTRCEICDRTFKDAEGLAMHNKAKHPESMSREKKLLPIKKVRNWSILVIAVGLIIVGIAWGISNIERLRFLAELDIFISSNGATTFPKDLLIFALPSIPGRVPDSGIKDSGIGKTSLL